MSGNENVMKNDQIAFVAYQEQDNLGVGYMASVLLERGFRVASIDIQLGTEAVVSHLKELHPMAIGFSIIFQHQLRQFRSLIRDIRNGGITCHLCAGGHYPSMRYQELLDFIPELDSIGLFEGEHTFLELCEALRQDKDWTEVHGLAFRHNGDVKATPLRPLVADLDTLPVPVRRPERSRILGKGIATLLASRGCCFDCTFCSIRRFYSTPRGPLKRVRRPECVVAEMKYLYDELGCSIFFFQDDDFPLSGRPGREWVSAFCKRLVAERLSDRVLWKASCRPTEVDYGVFRVLMDHGLGWVYLGLESGTDAGLKLMNKHFSKEAGPRAVGVLKQIGLAYSFGFMPFDPNSTFASVSENLDFLDDICGDGSSPVTFCKMLPYVETPVEYRLKQAGRLIGKTGLLDYRFEEPALDRYYAFLAQCFRGWIQDRQGVNMLSNEAIFSLVLFRKFMPTGPEFDSLARTITNTIAESNQFFLNTARDLMPWFRNRGCRANRSELLAVEDCTAAAEARYCRALLKATSAMEELAGKTVMAT